MIPAFPILLSSRGTTENFPADSAYSHASLETMHCQSGRIPLWPLHRARLLRSGHVTEEQLAPVDNALLKICGIGESINALKVRLRLGVLSDQFSWDLSAVPLDSIPGVGPAEVEYGISGISLFVCKTRLRLSETDNPGCKLLQRTRYNQAAAELANTPVSCDGLLLDERGYVIETLRCNLLLWRDGQWLTPDLSRSGVHGVMRSWLAQRIDLQYTNLTLADLIAADSQSSQELALCNSVRGVIPVCGLIDNSGISVAEEIRSKNGWTIGPQTRRLQQLIAEELW